MGCKTSTTGARRPAASRPLLLFACAVLALYLISLSKCTPRLVVSVKRLSRQPPAVTKLSGCPATATPFPSSFWYVKTHKTGSSTLAGVFRSICAHYGITTVRRDLLYAAQHDNPAQLDGKDNADMNRVAEAVKLAHRASESAAVAVVNHLRLTDAKLALLQPEFIFSSVRHPVPRIYSQFVDKLCWDNRGKLDNDACWFFNSSSAFGQRVLSQDTLERRWQFVKTYDRDQSFHYMRGSAATVEEALDQYAFVFVAERMDESLVAFKLLYGLTFEDIAYLPSKNKTGSYKTAADMPQEMNTYIEQNHQLDILLWQLANKRLDAAIRSLQSKCGVGHFQQHLETFKALQRFIRETCGDYKGWHEKYGIPGPYAYVADNGVGYRCIQHQTRLYLAGATGATL